MSDPTMTGTSTPAVAPFPESTKKPMGQLERTLKVFYAPSETFEDLRRSTNWLVPFILLVVCTVGYGVVAGQKIGWPQIAENNQKMMSPKQQQQMQDRMEKATPEQREQQQKIMLKITQGIAYGFPVVLMVILLIFAAIYMAVMNFGLGAEMRFGEVFAVIMYSGVVRTIWAILAVIGIYTFIDPADFMIQMPLATNPATMFNVSIADHRFLFSLLANFDIFAIWATALTGLGLSKLSKKTLGTCMAVAFGVLIGFALLTSLPALL